MILNNAFDVKFGTSSVQKVMLGTQTIWSASGFLISKNNLTSGGLTVGAAALRDMATASRNTIAAAAAGPTALVSTRSYWADWGNDIFDGWGYFYIYDPAVGNYYSIVLENINNANGVIATETFTFNNRVFTIKHGHAVDGIYKMDVSVNDGNLFVFGTDGNMGSDLNTSNSNLTHNYSVNEKQYKLFYNYNRQSDRLAESLYSYFVPYQESLSQEVAKPYTSYSYSTDNLAIYTNPIRYGVTAYFAKQNDVKLWVANDITFTTILS